MAGKNARVIIADALADLSKEELQKFSIYLLERRDGLRIRRSQVDGKNYLDISGVVVEAFTDSRAIEVTLALLREIGCNRVAADLEADAKELNTPTANSGGASGTAAAQQEHFVDRHRLQLTNRVSNISPILDQLLIKKVLRQEQYDQVSCMRPTQEQMRFLYTGPLKASKKCKDVFLSALETEESYLIQDLKESEG